MNQTQTYRSEVIRIIDQAAKLGAEAVRVSNCLGDLRTFDIMRHHGFVDAVYEAVANVREGAEGCMVYFHSDIDPDESVEMGWVFLRPVDGGYPVRDLHFGPGYDQTFCAGLQSYVNGREQAWEAISDAASEMVDTYEEQHGYVG